MPIPAAIARPPPAPSRVAARPCQIIPRRLLRVARPLPPASPALPPHRSVPPPPPASGTGLRPQHPASCPYTAPGRLSPPPTSSRRRVMQCNVYNSITCIISLMHCHV
ncbi:hypothetical protein GUJ93_ZPchr0014g47634 [Zizania palustris]|uniref:Uncharacterized protein n=1 Tax=Zizania palustris TaxID=103762 RepID=A0A8J5W5M0_ZIZPA|nr:hypothetical protein GUJ93_ZPchr0014g47634 [Zizania palustris]